ncbi:uncharacterized protein L3040_002341 [Drepanopeziza brunnea f. sp. 'multigermtubi']|uniref:Uncharacterized protein n=1 Tax=Marssonina brunnea f. sp. multigermtubi (strain MB_m1) TaxID=1072389 RepID=K1X444_MARBU|nr:uncharacterized protein MBM_01933 [Drepanopeziza brunnea f. sp. 'multigermtubi' MB_m1]EKD19981.1 hypothetical protein MBM_01933 [Drepanopeziza brunnea f. sp. 'multigermtubi' MB_m1]KAJ5050458.1 hypothetical protein L3040_002341 [Drepanopeziza brunnea f. sp. 'multigermtubi']
MDSTSPNSDSFIDISMAPPPQQTLLCCPLNPISQTSSTSDLVSNFLLALRILGPSIALTSPNNPQTMAAPTDTTQSPFPTYPATHPIPRELVLLQTVRRPPATDTRVTEQRHYAQLPDKDEETVVMYPDEVFGLVEESRVEELWNQGWNWTRREDLGDDRESGRVTWRCVACRREYSVRRVRLLEAERE